MVESAHMLSPSTAAQWVGAIATSAAVAIALFKEEWLRYFRRPQLTLRIEPSPPDSIFIPTFVSANNQLLWSGSAYWLRLWVRNEGRGRAEQVQVFLAQVQVRGADHQFSRIANFTPMNLRWSNSPDQNRPEIFAPGISRGLGKHCDLCYISDPGNPTLAAYQGQCVADLVVEVIPNDGSHRLQAGEYRLEIMLGSANARPVTRWISLNLTGGWSPNPQLIDLLPEI